MNKFLLLFIAVPLIEMLVLIKVGQQIGALSTIALVILTAVIGIALLKQQGLAMLNRANWKMNQGQLPAREMAEGIVLAVGGALLLTPGFVTDAFGFICLLPGSRHFLLQQVLKNISINPIDQTSTGYGSHQTAYETLRQAERREVSRETSIPDEGDVIEGEYEKKK